MADKKGSEAPTTPASIAAGADELLPPPSSEAQRQRNGADADEAALSAQAYLERNVMGVLALGLEDVCRVRPQNPVDYLGCYLLRRSSANNTVEVAYDDTIPKSVHAEGDAA